jgi:hypothetical protein
VHDLRDGLHVRRGVRQLRVRGRRERCDVPRRLPVKWLLVLLFACGGRQPSRPIVDEAARWVAANRGHHIRIDIALAHAQAVAKQVPAAKASLEHGLSIARTTESLTELLESIDVLVALGDQAGATKVRDEVLEKYFTLSHRTVLIRDAYADTDLQSPLALQTLADLAVSADGDVTEDLEVGSRAWDALVAHECRARC